VFFVRRFLLLRGQLTHTHTHTHTHAAARRARHHRAAPLPSLRGQLHTHTHTHAHRTHTHIAHIIITTQRSPSSTPLQRCFLSLCDQLHIIASRTHAHTHTQLLVAELPTPPEQRRFLRFQTGCPRCPPLVGIAALLPRLTVVRKWTSGGQRGCEQRAHARGSFKVRASGLAV
jgi:hypothetical protein